jgi:hypothetical protein
MTTATTMTTGVTSGDRLKLIVSTLLLVIFVILSVLWAFSYVRVITIHRRTIVECGSVIEGADREYSSHTRTFGTHVGRIYLIYLRSDELNKSKNLPRRVDWRFDVWRRAAGHDRYDAPQWVARMGMDWHEDVQESPRENGEYWSNRHIATTLPFWMLTLPVGVLGWLIGRRGRLKRRRLRRGLCIACGYDVRMSPDRCPECGLTTSPAPPSPGTGL